jgi:hypothetical protein
MPKRLIIILISYLLPALAFAQGSTCGTANTINMNGVLANFPTSISQGVSVVCTNYTGFSPVTWFKFTTNASASCPLMQISASDNQQMEIAFYTSCSGAQSLQTTSSMCFDDGTGIWAPAETYVLSANTTYYLRIKTQTACTIAVAGQHYTPPNTTCAGAFTITGTAISDNNACHTASTEVTASDICAFTIENTAFYKFTIASSGSAIINISNISCDNGNANNTTGFQIGFFKGSCGALEPLNCTSGSGTFVQATTDPQPAGTLIYVAIDGYGGSNCKYSISGINVYGVLSEDQFSMFSVWKTSSTNLLRWKAIPQNLAYYEVERSANGQNFQPIGTVTVPSSASNFSFEDKHPIKRCYYRVKLIDQQGKKQVSHIIQADRTDVRELSARIVSTDPNRLKVQLEMESAENINYQFTTLNGTVLDQGIIKGIPGIQTFNKSIERWPGGIYLVQFSARGQAKTLRFIRP